MPQDLSNETWDEIRNAYETSAESVKEIAVRFAVSAGRISAQVQPRGWKPRPTGAAALLMANAKRAANRLEAAFRGSPGDTKPTPPRLTKAGAGGSPTHRKALTARLYNLLDSKLAQMEARVASQAEITGVETEREARQFSSLIKIFENLTDLTDANVSAIKPTTDPDTDDSEHLCEALVQRFERLRQSSGEAPPAVGPQAE